MASDPNQSAAGDAGARSASASEAMVALHGRAVRGSILSIANQAVRLLLNAGTTLLLGLYLQREEFGLVAVAVSIGALANLLRDGGLTNALIQRRGLTDLEMNSVFRIHGTIGVIGALALVAMARPLADYWGQPRLALILVLMGGALLAQTLAGVQEAHLRKALHFGKLMAADLLSITAASIAAIVVVLAGGGVWGLVIRVVAAPLLFAALIWALSTWRPRWQFSVAAVRPLWSFGAYVFVGTLLGYGVSLLDALIIGKLLGVAAAGTFFFARQLALTPLTEAAGALARVMFPVFSTIQDDAASIRSGYFTGTRSLALILFPIIAGLIAVSPEAVNVILGERWRPAVPVIQVLSLHGVVACLNHAAAQVLYARGRSRLMFVLAAIRGMAALSSFVIGCRWGVVGVAVAWTVALFTVGPLPIWFAAQEVDMRLTRIFANILRPACAAAGAALAVRTFCGLWELGGGTVGYALVTCQVVVGMVSYAVLCGLLLSDTIRGLKRHLAATFHPQPR